MRSSGAPVEAEGDGRAARRPDPTLGRLLDQAAIVVAYSELLAQHATELQPPHQHILLAIQGAAARIRDELLAARATGILPRPAHEEARRLSRAAGCRAW